MKSYFVFWLLPTMKKYFLSFDFWKWKSTFFCLICFEEFLAVSFANISSCFFGLKNFIVLYFLKNQSNLWYFSSENNSNHELRFDKRCFLKTIFYKFKDDKVKITITQCSAKMSCSLPGFFNLHFKLTF